MKLKMTKDIDILYSSQSIYDFTAAIYSLIDRSDNNAIGIWNRWKASSDGQALSYELENLLSLDITLVFTEHKEFIKEYISLLEQNKDMISSILIETIILCDRLIGEQEVADLPGTYSEKGPMNLNSGATDISLYYCPPHGLYDEVKKANKLRNGGNISIVTKSRIDKKINSIILLDKEQTNGYEIHIGQYVPSCDIKKTGYSVGIVPVFNAPWFEMVKDNTEKRFSVVYNDGIDDVNSIIINCINEAFEQNVDFLVFPEIVVNERTYDEVDNYLKHNYDRRSNLKLIFLGTNWSDGNNVGYVLTAAGTKLHEINKINPYSHYDKDEKQEYEEALKRMDKKIYMVDIEGIGRISYSICRDGLVTDVIPIKAGYLGSDIEVISSYTSKTDRFADTAKASTLEHFRANILCNSCAAINENGTRSAAGFISIPCVIDSKVECRQEFLYKNAGCDRIGGFCSGCVNVFSI